MTRSWPTLAKPTLASLFGDRLWPNRLWPNRVRLVLCVLCVCVCCVAWVWVSRFRFGHVRCSRNRLPRTALPWTAQNFALFSLSRRKIRSFLPSLGVFSLNFGGVLKTKTLKCARLALGLSCETPTASGPPGLHTTARELQTCTFETPPKFHEKTPREGRKEHILRREREKSAKFLAPHPSGPHPSNPHPSGLHFWPPPFWPPPSGPHFIWVHGAPPLHPPTTTQHTKKNQTINSPKPKSLHTTKP